MIGQRGGMPHGGQRWEIWPWRLNVRNEGTGLQRFQITAAEKTVVRAVSYSLQTGEIVGDSTSSQFAVIAETGSGVYAGKSASVDIANAQLMTSAPELAEALAAMVYTAVATTDAQFEAHRKAEAALTKAGWVGPWERGE